MVELEQVLDPNQQVLADIEKACDMEGEPIDDVPDSDDKRVKMANYVYTGLLGTLSDVGLSLYKNTLQKNPLTKESEELLRAVRSIAQMARALTENKIPLHPDVIKSQKLAASAYSLSAFNVGATKYGNIEVLVRPHILINRSPPLGNATGLDMREPRFRLDFVPMNSPFDLVGFRIDQNGIEKGQGIIYDLQIMKAGNNILDRVPLSVKSRIVSHHFDSRIFLKGSSVTFADILDQLDQKIKRGITYHKAPRQFTSLSSREPREVEERNYSPISR